jgi:predicted metal-dependent hydrolase
LENSLKINGRTYGVEYVKASGRTSSVRIRGGKVVLRLSRFLRGRKMDETIEKFLKWSKKTLAEAEICEFAVPKFEDSGVVATHNKVYQIKAVYEERNGCFSKIVDGSVILIKIPLNTEKGKVKHLAEKVIMEDQKQYLLETIDELNQLHFQSDYNMCRFKRMDSRLGSCSKRRNLNIALKTLFMPREVFRYICLHELAHLKEMNHSKRFWALVSEAMPGYKEQEKWLKKNLATYSLL